MGIFTMKKKYTAEIFDNVEMVILYHRKESERLELEFARYAKEGDIKEAKMAAINAWEHAREADRLEALKVEGEEKK